MLALLTAHARAVPQDDTDRALWEHGGLEADPSRRMPEDRRQQDHGSVPRLLSRPHRRVKKDAPGQPARSHHRRNASLWLSDFRPAKRAAGGWLSFLDARHAALVH